MNKFWFDEDLRDLKKATSFKEIGVVALRVQSRMPYDLMQVCGPISSGGHGSIEKNLDYFHRVIKMLSENNDCVYDQLPLEDAIRCVVDLLDDKFTPKDLLMDIYLPLFESGKIKKLYFIHGWESSKGAKWEHNKGKELGIEIIYLPKDFI
ncbi:DUF4406 domain-containing protein [Candidatus Woesearchaeota archaeon]|nr:DUF4406 domain-containing protein [Candidatus Woesearchaeota archaeon]MCF7901474.1 DUF4406 domain-containing protein [Candidatus Woesearchaeota archaeon]MCF8013193.1 DUF4406 domain-containing protein [Candidatus Woesearchaeota archaeon]